MSGADNAAAVVPSIGAAGERKPLTAARAGAVVPKGFAFATARTHAKVWTSGRG